MPQLADGTVVPSFLGISRTAPMADGLDFDNTRLRLGEVQDVVYPDDPRSLSKKFVEYRVLVQQRSNRVGVGKVYEGCCLSNWFGGVADMVRYTLRTGSGQNKSKSGLGVGSKVLLLCVNGETNQAVIVGGIRDQADDDDGAKAMGHHLVASFNGVVALVDSDGEFSVTYGGKTEADGSTKAAKASTGTYLKLLKNGNAVLSDSDGSNAVTVDHANHKVTIARDQAFELGAATDYMLLGQSFRTQQQQLHATMSSLFQALQALVTVAGAQLMLASAANLPPIIGGVLAAPFFLAAATALTASGPILGQLGAAIQAFEQAGQAKNSFLSAKNRSD